MALKSVDSPEPLGPFESNRETATSKPRDVIGGTVGEADAAPSRASKRFLVRGTRGEPLRKPASVFESLLTDVDRRKQILETELTPWRMICALEITSQNGSTYTGTGWFAAPRTVITAGHCVFDPVELGGWAKSIKVIPGRDDDDEPFGSAKSARFSTTDTWLATQAEAPDFDYAAIHLDADLGSKVGTFGIGVLPDAELSSRLVNVSGYPVSPGNGRQQYFHANRVKAVTPRRVFYDVDTIGGQSGSPVWAYLDGNSEVPTVVAIHAYGVGGVPANLHVVANSGPRILPDVMDVLKGWIKRGTP
ncbi:trypsin-like serine peptidase [Thiocapsa bogorovii]|uniref:trypsin-like serine peptidase n=1 Tax=Thiocapsa bogorovii TaxID=521689 RepID=UPI001E4B33EB|nr:trypsin-like peptidase domain-containing protein [Thiocapsa bogorovii]UHD16362.1 trypsin-like peptidase domain-containing protein [Thiocapsa bogorovii]